MYTVNIYITEPNQPNAYFYIDKILNNVLIKINASLRLNDIILKPKSNSKTSKNLWKEEKTTKKFILTNYQFNTNYCWNLKIGNKYILCSSSLLCAIVIIRWKDNTTLSNMGSLYVYIGRIILWRLLFILISTHNRLWRLFVISSNIFRFNQNNNENTTMLFHQKEKKTENYCNHTIFRFTHKTTTKKR